MGGWSGWREGGLLRRIWAGLFIELPLFCEGHMEIVVICFGLAKKGWQAVCGLK